MADSTTPLDLIAVGQANKEDTANELFDALSPAALYGRRASTCTGLTWGYYGGRYLSDPIDNDTLSLTANVTNYIVADAVTGEVSVSASSTNWDDTENYIRLYLVVCGASAVTSYEDHRQAIWPWIGEAGGGGGGASFVEIDYSGNVELFTVPQDPFEITYV